MSGHTASTPEPTRRRTRRVRRRRIRLAAGRPVTTLPQRVATSPRDGGSFVELWAGGSCGGAAAGTPNQVVDR